MLDNGVTNVYDTVNIGVNDAIDNAIDLESDA
jgi:hypothetical protein